MGEAKKRGDYITRRADAVAAGRIKRPNVSRRKIERQVLMSDLSLLSPELAMAMIYAGMGNKLRRK